MDVLWRIRPARRGIMVESRLAMARLLEYLSAI